MLQDDEDILALLICSNNNFADAYQLCKVLSWKFGIINCSEIIQRIILKGYVTVTYPKSPTLKCFALTEEGKVQRDERSNLLIKKLKEELPDLRDFVDRLGSF